MATGSGSTAHRLHTVVTEAIDAIAEPSEARAILAEALTSAGLPALPSEPDTLALFVSLWLRGSLSRRMGDVAANLVETELTRVLDASVAADRERDAYSTGVRARRPWPGEQESETSRPTVPALDLDSLRTPVVTPLARRMLLVATSDERAALDFRRLEDDVTLVAVVANTRDLVAAIGSVEDRAPILVLDEAWPTVPAVMLATSRLELPSSARVVLFRYDDNLVKTLRAFSPRTERWHAIHRGARAVDVLAYVTRTPA